MKSGENFASLPITSPMRRCAGRLCSSPPWRSITSSMFQSLGRNAEGLGIAVLEEAGSRHERCLLLRVRLRDGGVVGDNFANGTVLNRVPSAPAAFHGGEQAEQHKAQRKIDEECKGEGQALRPSRFCSPHQRQDQDDINHKGFASH